MFAKLKKKWGIENNVDFTLIMLAFSLAGIGISVVRPIVFHLLHLDHAPLWTKVLVYLPLIVPIYQFNLLIFGTLLGQFSFFWDWEKKWMARLGRVFSRVRA